MTLPWSAEELEDATTKALLSSAMGAMLPGVRELNMPDMLTNYAKYFVDLTARAAGPIQLGEAQNVAARMHSEYDDLFRRGFHAFVCPTVTTAAVPAFNLVYSVPVVNAPTGFDRNGVPTGIQICARSYQDQDAFDVAHALARVTPSLFQDDRFPTYRTI